MLLEITYKSGSTRRVNLHPSFFTTYEKSISTRAKDFAYDNGLDPYQITVNRDGEVVFEQTFRGNNPEESCRNNHYLIDESDIKKQLKKDWKSKAPHILSVNEKFRF